MKAKLIVEGREFPIEINHPELEKLLKPKKKTGYERVDEGSYYFYACSDGFTESALERGICSQDDYDAADYYSDRTIAENNARADKLMRQLRRYAVEQRKNDLDWSSAAQSKYSIYYDYHAQKIRCEDFKYLRPHGAIIFDSSEICELAIKIYHDELIWYFTEYKDSL